MITPVRLVDGGVLDLLVLDVGQEGVVGEGVGGGLVDQAGDDQDGEHGHHDERVDDHPVLVLARARPDRGHQCLEGRWARRGWAESPLHAMRTGRPAEASRRLRPGPPPPGVIRSVSWKGDRAVRTGGGPGRGRRRHPAPDQRQTPTAPEPATPIGWAPPPPGWARAGSPWPRPTRLAPGDRPADPEDSAGHDLDGSLGRQLGAGAARRHGRRPGCGCSSPRSGSSAVRSWPSSRCRWPPPSSREPALPHRHHQAVRTAHLVHRVDPDRAVGRLLRRRPGCPRRSGGPTAWSGTSACGSAGSTWSGVPIGVGGQFLVALMYIPIAQHVSNFNQRFDAPSQRLTGGFARQPATS